MLMDVFLGAGVKVQPRIIASEPMRAIDSTNVMPLIAAPQIAVALQFRHLLEQFPCALVALAPVLAVDAVADFSLAGHLPQSRLQGDAQVAADAG